MLDKIMVITLRSSFETLFSSRLRTLSLLVCCTLGCCGLESSCFWTGCCCCCCLGPYLIWGRWRMGRLLSENLLRFLRFSSCSCTMGALPPRSLRLKRLPPGPKSLLRLCRGSCWLPPPIASRN